MLRLDTETPVSEFLNNDDTIELAEGKRSLHLAACTLLPPTSLSLSLLFSFAFPPGRPRLHNQPVVVLQWGCIEGLTLLRSFADMREITFCLSLSLTTPILFHFPVFVIAGAPPPPSNKKHHAVQVVSFGDGTIDVDEDLLRSVLDVYGVRNLPVSVVSVAGKEGPCVLTGKTMTSVKWRVARPTYRTL